MCADCRDYNLQEFAVCMYVGVTERQENIDLHRTDNAIECRNTCQSTFSVNPQDETETLDWEAGANILGS